MIEMGCGSHLDLSTVNIGFRNHPPSEGSRFLNPARPLKQGSGFSNQVVAKPSGNKNKNGNKLYQPPGCYTQTIALVAALDLETSTPMTEGGF